MTTRRAMKLWAVRYLIDPTVRLLFASCRWEIEGLSGFLKSCETKPVILCVWHENLTMIPYWIGTYMPHIPVSALMSKSRDGQLLDSLRKNYPNIDSILVAHDSKHSSMRMMLQALEKKRVIVITPDGPQGPWKKAKAGAIHAAIWSEAEIWTLNWIDGWDLGSQSLRLPTADRMKLPLPFQKIRAKVKCLGTLQDRKQLASETARLEALLNSA